MYRNLGPNRYGSRALQMWVPGVFEKDERKRIQEDLPDDNRIFGQEKRGVLLLVNR